jgi:phosphate:Na+ symporter
MSLASFKSESIEASFNIESLEEVIDELKETLRSRHIERLQSNSCTIEAGFIWSDLLTNLERVSDHCSNIAGGIIDYAHKDRATHESLRAIKADKGDYKRKFEEYSAKYSI